MTLAARIYAATRGCDDEPTAIAVKDALGELLERKLATGLLTGYEVTALTSEDDWEREGLDRETIDAITGGAMPLVYVNITYNPDDQRQRDADLTDIVEAYRLQLVLEVTGPSR